METAWDGAAVWHSDLFCSLRSVRQYDAGSKSGQSQGRGRDARHHALSGSSAAWTAFASMPPDTSSKDRTGRWRITPKPSRSYAAIRAALAKEYPGALLVAKPGPGCARSRHTTTAARGSTWPSRSIFPRHPGRPRAGHGRPAQRHTADDSEFLDDPTFAAPFVSNHDMVRSMRSFEGNWAKARLAFATLMAWPGTPFVYYGEEIGMQGGPPKRTRTNALPCAGTVRRQVMLYASGKNVEPGDREAFGVDVETQQADPGSLWHLYQSLSRCGTAGPR